MTHETPAQRRTRLIEQYAGLIVRTIEPRATWNPEAFIKCASDIADAVIAATPQAQEPEPTRYPSEIESRLIDLVDSILFDSQVWERFPDCQAQLQSEFAAIKRDLGLV